MKKSHGYGLWTLAFVFSAVWLIPSIAFAQITASGLNTQISGPIAVGGQTQFNITGGTRPGGGTNLFHSFGNFNVPNNNIANFLNNAGLPTSNILGRVTGGNVSNIFGTIQTTGFGNANLFLINPSGFLFGPTTSVNVGGMVAFTSANYLKLADGTRFNAIPNAAADAILSAAPVAAFGFLGAKPGAITVQGSQLTVAEGTGLSLVGGNITVQDGTLTAPSGQISLVSVRKPSNLNVGGEVAIAGAGQGAGFTPTEFRSLGTITLIQGSTVAVSSTFSSHQPSGNVVIRGGQFVMDNSSINASADTPGGNAGNVEVTANQIALSRSQLSTFGLNGEAGNITLNANTVSAIDSNFSAFTDFFRGGAVTIQGLLGSNTYAHAISLRNTTVLTNSLLTLPGPITIRGNNISLNHTTLSTGAQGTGGPITLVSRGNLCIQDSLLDADGFSVGGTVDLRAGTSLDVTSTIIEARGTDIGGPSSITMAAPIISLRGSTVVVIGVPGTISLTGTKAVSLNSTVLSADSFRVGGTIQINGGARFTSQQSTISTQGSSFGNSGTIHVDANRIELTDSHLNTSTSGGPGTVGGSITVDARKMTLTNSQILSTATEGHGGTIDVTGPIIHQNASSVIDASSQLGTNGTVTINGVIQP